MKRRHYRDDLREFRQYDRSYSDQPTKGLCGCGVETSSNITVGPPGHPENGWMCKACQELRLRFEMEKANLDPRRI